jgi:hypothetical protein
MIRRKIMNNKDQENGERTGPLIFTVPAYGFVMALYLDWLGRSDRAGRFCQNTRVELSANSAENGEGYRGRGVERKAGRCKPQSEPKATPRSISAGP